MKKTVLSCDNKELYEMEGEGRGGEGRGNMLGII